MQLDVVWVEQAPVPLQLAGADRVDPLQLAGAQETFVPAFWRFPAPSHAPVNPQVVLPVQRACGSVVPDVTFEQVPRWPVTLQAWHVLQEVAEQQTLSTQL